MRGGRPGKYTLKALPFKQFPGANSIKKGGMEAQSDPPHGPLDGSRAPTIVSRRGALPHPSYFVDLRKKHVDRNRTIVFSEMQTSPTNTNYLLNGQMFDPN